MPVHVAVNKVITSALLAHVADYTNRAPADGVSARLETADPRTDRPRPRRAPRPARESGN